MTQPLALIYYQMLLPGSTLANRLRDLHYRVHAAADPTELLAVAREEGPMVLLLDVSGEDNAVIDSIRELRAASQTAHLPILAFAEDEQRQALARAAGANLVAGNAAMGTHFEELLQQVLGLD